VTVYLATLSYSGGPQRALDLELEAVAERHGGVFSGSGMWLDEGGLRDLDFEFEDAQAAQQFLDEVEPREEIVTVGGPIDLDADEQLEARRDPER
jgi:hypothetical protein